jgi:iron complex outermembrane receptor protein
MPAARPPRFARHRLAVAARGSLRTFGTITAIGTLATLPGIAAAQGAAAGSDGGALQTVTISAERRLENLRDVPVSASVLQGEILEVINTSGQDVRALSGRVPSLNIESSFGRAFPRFYVRGYGNTDFRLNASQPVSLVYDDVVQENPILKGFPAFDLERIEVLRGPQGSLFGRNTPAGVVKFDSVKPGSKADAYGSISVGTYKTINAEGAATLPLSEGLSMRLSVLSQTRDDWVDNTFAAGRTQQYEGYRDSALRGQLLVSPSKDFSALLGVHARDYEGSARLFRANIIKPGTNDLVDGFDAKKVSQDGQNASELQNYGANLRLRWNLGAFTLHSITGYETVRTYSGGDIDGGFFIAQPFPTPAITGPGVIPFSVETADGIPKHSQITQEVRIEGGSPTSLAWQAGLYFFSEDYKIESFSYDTPNGSALDGYQRVKQKNDAVALFGSVNLVVAPGLQVRGGLRYTQDKKTFDVEDYFNTGFAACFGPSNGIIPGPIKCTLAQLRGLEPDGRLDASTKDNKVSGDLSATWALDKDVNLYARAATGFRGSSVQGASAFNGKSVAGPETVTSLEAGVKADLLNRRLRVNFGVFNYEVKDLQLTAVGGAANANILLNAAKATGRGFELDMQALLSSSLLATLGVGYNDTKLKDPALAVAVCASCTVTDPRTAGGQALIDGNPLPQAPKVTANFTLKYTQPLANGDLYVLTDWVYRSKVNFFLYESVEFTGKALTEGGLRVGYGWGNGKYDAALFGRNITNQVRIVGGIDFNNLTGFINEPRTWGVQFRANF